MTARPVQASMLDGYPDRNVGPVLGSVQTGTNADLIAKVAPLYLTGSVLDVTYGRGKWWGRFRPDDFTFHDLALDGVDFRDLPHPDASFDAVCFDPPYVSTGGTATNAGIADFRDGFGIGRGAALPGPRNRGEVADLFRAGLAEAARVVRPSGFILAKCMDYTESGTLQLAHMDMLKVADVLGLSCWDLYVHHTGGGPPAHNTTVIRRARRAHSYLLVFTGGERHPRGAAVPVSGMPTEAAVKPLELHGWLLHSWDVA